MARKFPTWLYSSPQNSKSEGPFLVYTLAPRLLFRVYFSRNAVIPAAGQLHKWSGYVGVLLLDPVPMDVPVGKLMDIAERAVVWLEKQGDEGFVDIPIPITETSLEGLGFTHRPTTKVSQYSTWVSPNGLEIFHDPATACAMFISAYRLPVGQGVNEMRFVYQLQRLHEYATGVRLKSRS